MGYVGALVAQGFSFWTTLAFVTLFTQPGTDTRQWGVTLLYAVLAEILFMAMKEQIFKKGCASRGVGIVGFLGDGFINAGGLTAIAVGVLTFGPAALMLGAFEVNLADPATMLSATGLTSLVLGIVLSITPHILWRNAKTAAARQAA